MNVKQLIEALAKMPPESPVYYVHVDPDSGCDTCGYGARDIEGEIGIVTDMESKVWLED